MNECCYCKDEVCVRASCPIYSECPTQGGLYVRKQNRLKDKNANKNALKLSKLIARRPDLPVIPIVSYEVVPEDYGYWTGSIGQCFIGECAFFNDRYYDDRSEFEEDYYNYNDTEINKNFNYDPSFELPLPFSANISEDRKKKNKIASDKVDAYLEDIANNYFKDAIIVYIEVPKE